jgi:hypothetical protein
VEDEIRITLIAQLVKAERALASLGTRLNFIISRIILQLTMVIFEFIACLNGLNSRYDFKKILEIIEKMMDECYFQIPDSHIEEFVNHSNGSSLSIISEGYSELFIDKHFKKQTRYLEGKIFYRMHLVMAFRVTNLQGEWISYEFDHSRPQEAFYALSIKGGQFYVLFNPRTGKNYQWGEQPEFYVIGTENLFKIAYFENIMLRDTLVLTNSVIGLLYLQDKGIPCVAVLNGELDLPEFFEETISPLFPHRHLLLDIGPKSEDQRKAFLDKYGYDYIRLRGTSYLAVYFKRKDAVDEIMSQLTFSEGFEYTGYASSVTRVK